MNESLTVVLPFADDEDRIGAVIRQFAAYLEEQDLGGEIIAVDCGSGDNSRALLNLLAHKLPVLRVVTGASFVTGCLASRSTQVVVARAEDVDRVGISRSLAPCLRRLSEGQIDLQLLEEHLFAFRRAPCQELWPKWRYSRVPAGRNVLQRAAQLGLKVEGYGPERIRLRRSIWELALSPSRLSRALRGV